MKNYIIIFVLLFGTKNIAQVQLSLEKDYWSGIAVYQNGSKISIKKAMELAQKNQSIVQKFASARTYRTISDIISFPSSFIVGYTLGTALNKNVKTNWTAGGIGLIGMIGGGVLRGNGNRQLKEAISEFNNASKATASFQPELEVLTNENGFGIVIRY